MLPYMDLARLRWAAIDQALQTTRGHKGRAARLLGVHANTLTRMLAQMEAEAAENDAIVPPIFKPRRRSKPR